MKGLSAKLLIFCRRHWPFVLMVSVVIGFFWKVILYGWVPIPGDFVVGVYFPWLDYKWGFPAGVPVKNPIMADVVSFVYPMQKLSAEMMRAGQWPLWNPYILGGAPLLANFQSAPFAPTVLVWFLFDGMTAWSLQVMLQHLLVLVFTYLLLREWKISKLGAVVGGAIFAFSGYNMIWSQWNGHALVSAFLPLVLIFQDRFLKNGKYWAGFGVSLAVAGQILSGYPQGVIYAAIAVVVLWMFRFERSKEYVVKSFMLLIFGLIGLGLAAPQVLPGAELLKHSQREVEPHPFEWAFLPWEKMITFFAPDYFGNHSTANYWGPQDYTSNTGFVGVVAVVLASFGVILMKQKRHAQYGFGIVVISLLLSFPTFVSVYLWQSGFLGLQAASAHRALVLFNFGVAILAGFGVDGYLKTKRKTWWIVVLPGVVLGGFFAFAGYKYIGLAGSVKHLVRGIPMYWVALRNLVLPMTILGTVGVMIWVGKRRFGIMVMVTLMVFELFRFGWKFNPVVPRSMVYPTTPVLEYLLEQEKPMRVTGSSVIPINIRMTYGLESLEGYDAVYPVDAARFIAALNKQRVGVEAQGRYAMVDNDTSHLMDMVNTKYYLALKRDEKGNPDKDGMLPEKYKNERFSEVFSDKTTVILESMSVLPRAFVVYDWEVISDREEAMERLLDVSFPIANKIVLEAEIGTTAQEGFGGVEYLKYQENESEMMVKTSEAGMLFVSDLYFPGWSAYVDGVETDIHRANYAFRAIEVEAGEHVVSFQYKPKSFSKGLGISGFSMAILGILFVGNRKWTRYTSKRS